MEILKSFCNQNKNQLKQIFEKEKVNDKDSVLVINFTKPDDIKVTCMNVLTIEPKLLTNLYSVQKQHNDETNEKYAITIKDEQLNIIKYC